MDAGVKKKPAVVYALLMASLTTPLGAFIAHPFVGMLSETGMGLTLGFMAGVLIDVSASHLLPAAIGEEKEHSLFAFLGGVALAVFIVASKLLWGRRMCDAMRPTNDRSCNSEHPGHLRQPTRLRNEHHSQ